MKKIRILALSILSLLVGCSGFNINLDKGITNKTKIIKNECKIKLVYNREDFTKYLILPIYGTGIRKYYINIDDYLNRFNNISGEKVVKISDLVITKTYYAGIYDFHFIYIKMKYIGHKEISNIEIEFRGEDISFFADYHRSFRGDIYSALNLLFSKLQTEICQSN